MEIFKIRSSAIGHIMAGSMGLTEIQKSKLETLSNKANPTLIQQKELAELQQKMIFPELPQTAKSYCEDWLKERLYDKRIEFTSKYTEKGNDVEDASIDFVATQLGYGMLSKNEDWFENEFITGTPDIIPPTEVIDMKNSWSFETFPLFETEVPNTNYYWQAQGYMDLTKKDKFRLVFTLMNTPDYLIEAEVRKYCFSNGIDMEDADYQMFYDKMTYDNTPELLRIKIFEIKKNEDDIQKIYQRVKECRKYVDKLFKTLPIEIQKLFI